MKVSSSVNHPASQSVGAGNANQNIVEALEMVTSVNAIVTILKSEAISNRRALRSARHMVKHLYPNASVEKSNLTIKIIYQKLNKTLTKSNIASTAAFFNTSEALQTNDYIKLKRLLRKTRAPKRSSIPLYKLLALEAYNTGKIESLEQLLTFALETCGNRRCHRFLKKIYETTLSKNYPKPLMIALIREPSTEAVRDYYRAKVLSMSKGLGVSVEPETPCFKSLFLDLYPKWVSAAETGTLCDAKLYGGVNTNVPVFEDDTPMLTRDEIAATAKRLVQNRIDNHNRKFRRHTFKIENDDFVFPIIPANDDLIINYYSKVLKKLFRTSRTLRQPHPIKVSLIVRDRYNHSIVVSFAVNIPGGRANNLSANQIEALIIQTLRKAFEAGNVISGLSMENSTAIGLTVSSFEPNRVGASGAYAFKANRAKDSRVKLGGKVYNFYSPALKENNCVLACIAGALKIKINYTNVKKSLGLSRTAAIPFSLLEAVATKYNLKINLRRMNLRCIDDIQTFNPSGKTELEFGIVSLKGDIDHCVWIKGIHSTNNFCSKCHMPHNTIIYAHPAAKPVKNIKCNPKRIQETNRYFLNIRDGAITLKDINISRKSFDAKLKNIITYDLETMPVDIGKGRRHCVYAVGVWFRDCFHSWTGEECITEFLGWVNNLDVGDTKILGFNNSRFDNYLILQKLQELGMIDSINCERNRLLGMDIETIKSTVKVGDVAQFCQGTLKKLAEGFEIKTQKGDFDFARVKSFTDLEGDVITDLLKYLEGDVKATYELAVKFAETIFDALVDETTGKGPYAYNVATGPALAYTTIFSEAIKQTGKHIEVPAEDAALFIKASIYGGRCYPTKREYTHTDYDKILAMPPAERLEFVKGTGDYLVMKDVKSEYPAVMHKMAFPCGKGYWKEGGDNVRADFNAGNMGFIHCRMKAPNNLRHPIVPSRHRDVPMDALLACDWKAINTWIMETGVEWKLGTFEGIYDTLTIQRAIEYGYTVSLMDVGYFYPDKYRLFEGPVGKIYALKAQQDVYRSTNDPRFSPAVRQTMKILLNAAYGATIMKPTLSSKVMITNRADYVSFCIENEVTCEIEMEWDSDCDCTCIYLEGTSVEIKVTRPYQIGAFVLSGSKQILDDFVLEGNNPSDQIMFYGDTDSAVQHVSTAIAEESSELGGWEKEMEGPIIAMKSSCPKVYSLQHICVETGELLWKNKAKGFCQNKDGGKAGDNNIPIDANGNVIDFRTDKPLPFDIFGETSARTTSHFRQSFKNRGVEIVECKRTINKNTWQKMTLTSNGNDYVPLGYSLHNDKSKCCGADAVYKNQRLVCDACDSKIGELLLGASSDPEELAEQILEDFELEDAFAFRRDYFTKRVYRTNTLSVLGHQLTALIHNPRAASYATDFIKQIDGDTLGKRDKCLLNKLEVVTLADRPIPIDTLKHTDRFKNKRSYRKTILRGVRLDGYTSWPWSELVMFAIARFHPSAIEELSSYDPISKVLKARYRELGIGVNNSEDSFEHPYIEDDSDSDEEDLPSTSIDSVSVTSSVPDSYYRPQPETPDPLNELADLIDSLELTPNIKYSWFQLYNALDDNNIEKVRYLMEYLPIRNIFRNSTLMYKFPNVIPFILNILGAN